MPKYRRYFDLGKCYFLTLVTKERESVFSEPDAIHLFEDSLEYCRNRYAFIKHAFVFLSDHIHLILEITGDFTPADLIRCLKRRFLICVKCGSVVRPLRGSPNPTIGLIQKYGTIWQKRYYDHVIRDDQDFVRHVEYIHYNPVKHGLVTNPFDWEYSSLSQFAYSRDWGINEPKTIVGMELG